MTVTTDVSSGRRGAVSYEAVLGRLLKDLGLTPALDVPLSDALGQVSAGLTLTPHPYPKTALAALEGYACRALDTLGASTFAGTYLDAPLARLAEGQPLPAGCDAVLPPPLYAEHGGMAYALGEVVPMDGVWAAGAWAPEGAPVVAAGRRISALDLFVLRELGVTRVLCRRARVRLVHFGGAAEANASVIAGLLMRMGAEVVSCAGEGLDAALQSGTGPWALTLVFGGQGHDAADFFAARGALIGQGVGLGQAPDLVVGVSDGAAVLCLPDALEGVLAATLALVHPLMAQALSLGPVPCETLPLATKIASPVGQAEVVLLAKEAGAWRRLWPSRLGYQRAEAFVVLGSGEEGAGAGTPLSAHRLTGWWE